MESDSAGGRTTTWIADWRVCAFTQDLTLTAAEALDLHERELLINAPG